jgi:hypothetical protein
MPRKKREILEEIEQRIESSDLLSDEEKQAARERAREHVLKARKEKAIDAYFEAAVKEEQRGYVREEQLEDFTVDLPEYTFVIRLDNVGYYHGCTYEVPYSVARSMAEIQAASWSHDQEIQGRKRHGDMMRQPLNRNISGKTGAVTTSNLERRSI